MRQSGEVENMPPVGMDIPARKGFRTNDPEMSPPSGSPGREGLTGHPIKEDTVLATQTYRGKSVRVPVVLKVYSTNFGRYAVVAQDKLMCRDCGYINLKNCSIVTNDNVQDKINLCSSPNIQNVQVPLSSRLSSPMSQHRGTNKPLSGLTKPKDLSFQIIPHNAEGQSLTFTVSSRTDLEQWLSVLTCSEDTKEFSPVIGSPRRRPLGPLNPIRGSSSRLVQKQSLMPALVEE